MLQGSKVETRAWGRARDGGTVTLRGRGRGGTFPPAPATGGAGGGGDRKAAPDSATVQPAWEPPGGGGALDPPVRGRGAGAVAWLLPERYQARHARGAPRELTALPSPRGLVSIRVCVWGGCFVGSEK